MNKRDAILAKKTFAARQVRVESKISKNIIEMQKAQASSPHKNATHKKTKPTISLNTSLDESVSMGTLPALVPQSRSGARQSMSRQQIREVLGDTGDSYSAIDILAMQDSTSASALVLELSNRSVTAKTSFRKMQARVKQELGGQSSTSKIKTLTGMTFSGATGQEHEPLGDLVDRGGRHVSSRAGSRSVGGGHRASTASPQSNNNFDNMFSEDNNQEGGRDVSDEHYFMPKVVKYRPDGASLMDVYRSKREDTWSKIIQSQLKEDESNKQRAKEEKDKYNDRFGALIKEQMEANKMKESAGHVEDERLARIQDESSKKTQDMQKGRVEAARKAHQQFINNAVEDIETKRVAREEALIEEITSSTMMVNKAKAAILAEAKKKEDSKIYHKKYQDDIYQDNLIRLARKDKEKIDDWDETRQIINKKLAMDDAEVKRRKKENDERSFRSAEGPAHRIVQEIKMRQEKNQNKFYQHLLDQGDQLNMTLMNSEDLQARRERELGQGLQDANLKTIKIKQKMKEDDDLTNLRILETMRKMIRDQESQVAKEREDKTKAGVRYQQELDHQLNDLRQRSMDQLTKTMTDDELKYNSSMLKKLGVKVI